MSRISQQKLLQDLPKIDEAISWVLQQSSLQLSSVLVKKVVKEVVARERESILRGASTTPLSRKDWLDLFSAAARRMSQPNLKRIINGTGVVIHTNLGRSLLSEKTLSLLLQAGGSYSNLEFDLTNGRRGIRYSLVEDLLCDLTGAEAALVVNNNAAAVLLCLDTLARGREVIVSRGQLVEIGGSFRIPDVMAKSGAVLVEVGATNRTHLRDYQGAINDQTAMLLRVHTSNFRIIGFTAEISPEEMATLAKKNELISMEDLGSGCLIDLSYYGFPYEPTVQDVVKSGIDVVTFSGDKLLGGPQAGIIVGRKEIVRRVQQNPLNRALRIDKFTLAALESVLREYYDPAGALASVPTLRMLTETAASVKLRGEQLYNLLAGKIEKYAELSLLPVDSRVGGGALPEHGIESWALGFSVRNMSLAALETALRENDIPVIGRIEHDQFLLDMRTIQKDELAELATILFGVFSSLPLFQDNGNADDT